MMPISRWGLLLGVMVGVGCLQVTQRNALFLKGYAVGERMKRVHAHETELSWLQADLAGLASPAGLLATARERQLTLVAWATWPTEASTAARRSQTAGRPRGAEPVGGRRTVSIAALNADDVLEAE